MNKAGFLIIFLCLVLQLSGQDSKTILKGQISYISAQNIYVRFESTRNISRGDTLFIYEERKYSPVLIIEQLSSISCVCRPLIQMEFKVSQEIFAFTFIKEYSKEKANPDTIRTNTKEKHNEIVQSDPAVKKEQLMQGRFSISSYSNLSGFDGNNNTRVRTTLVLNIGNHSNSVLSSENYLVFTHKFNSPVSQGKDIFNGLKVYNLSLKYNLNKHINLWLGRKINPKISNLGAVDGLQVEYNPGKVFIGAIGGSRPDYADYGFNFKLPEFGVYLGQNYISDSGLSVSSTLGLFEQKFHGKTDRRFAYFQHENSLLKNLNLMVSGELDLYKSENQLPDNILTLTSFYLSVRYKINRQLSMSGSFDQRKNVIYYETFRSFGDSVFEAATRKGIRLRINYHPLNSILISLGAGHQFRSGDNRSTNYINGTFTLSSLSYGSGTVSAHMIRTGFIDGKVAGLTLNRDFFSGKLNAEAGYRFEDYTFLSNETRLKQHIPELNFSWIFNRKLSLSLNCEKSFTGTVNYLSLYANLVKRF